MSVMIGAVSTVALRFPVAGMTLAACSGLHAHLYLGKIAASPRGGDRVRQHRVVAANWLRLIRGVSVLLLAADLVGLLVGHGNARWLIGLTLCAFIGWIAVLPRVHRVLDAGAVPRLAPEGALARDLLRTLRLERATLRADGVRDLPLLHTVLALGLVVAWGSAVFGPSIAQVALELGAPSAVRMFLPSPAAPPSPPSNPAAAPIEVVPDDGYAGVASAPTALPTSPCPDVTAVAHTLSQAVPAAVGTALYQAWFEVGGAVIGCPNARPVRSGTLYVVELAGGQDTPAQLVYGSGHASVVFSDMSALIAQELTNVVGVDDRLRWGLGTLQLLHLRGGSCELIQRYRQDSPALLPPAVTALALVIADRTGAMPRLLRQPLIPSGRAFEFALISADATGALRTIDTVTIHYRGGRAATVDTGESASDAQACPASRFRLAVVAGAVEKAVQAHS